jgi:hypothetical protein
MRWNRRPPPMPATEARTEALRSLLHLELRLSKRGRYAADIRACVRSLRDLTSRYPRHGLAEEDLKALEEIGYLTSNG